MTAIMPGPCGALTITITSDLPAAGFAAVAARISHATMPDYAASFVISAPCTGLPRALQFAQYHHANLAYRARRAVTCDKSYTAM